ncbi:unnamed protein product [Dovyalis caffra]|uniref:Uncharacterized protein n=1 Tax=Dovyalis caffra TaxID=77055 RepID=A0AAV1SAN3_9ROSI|nr:unnamed protein product [Dovyalis caffra]
MEPAIDRNFLEFIKVPVFETSIILRKKKEKKRHEEEGKVLSNSFVHWITNVDILCTRVSDGHDSLPGHLFGLRAGDTVQYIKERDKKPGPNTRNLKTTSWDAYGKQLESFSPIEKEIDNRFSRIAHTIRCTVRFFLKLEDSPERRGHTMTWHLLIVSRPSIYYHVGLEEGRSALTNDANSKVTDQTRPDLCCIPP